MVLALVDGGVGDKCNTVIDSVGGEVLLRLKRVITSFGFWDGPFLPFLQIPSERFEAEVRRRCCLRLDRLKVFACALTPPSDLGIYAHIFENKAL